ncbi:glyoxalase [Reticulibacter mediterranei]|uniref:Glyoxalase n=1 Tax=Reticulibacter mediterranei TaxID=2778369 RepID=A0A8J3J368_9CHLR|nr:VOC family protein [Reticulibacter mediterranei]GHO99921.1 glyoxalase [Reticulibacter mediterranei]
MSTANKYIRNGFGSVRSYIHGPLDLAAFVKQVFEAKEVERNADEHSVHIEMKIGDSLIALDLSDHPPTDSTWFTYASTYIYVEDVDAVYRRALEAGATSLQDPMDKPYQERNAGFKDSFGNIWGISTYIGSR